jgi:hypothetical protein
VDILLTALRLALGAIWAYKSRSLLTMLGIIIGVLEPKGRTPGGRDQDDAVYVPYSTAMRKLMGRRLPGIVYFIGVSAHSKQLVPEAKREIEELLRQRHKILIENDDDFTRPAKLPGLIRLMR